MFRAVIQTPQKECGCGSLAVKPCGFRCSATKRLPHFVTLVNNVPFLDNLFLYAV
jgi:hypothetical protein